MTRMRTSTIVTLAGLLVALLLLLVVYLFSTPTTLRIAVGPDDREHARLMSAFAQKLNSDHAPIRLKLLRKDGIIDTAQTIDNHEADLAVARSDRMPRDGQTIAILHRNPILFSAPPGSRLRQVADLRGKRIGLLRLTEENRNLLQVILRQDKIEPDQVTLVEVILADLPKAFSEHRIDVLMTIAPLQGALFEQAMATMARSRRATPVIFGVNDAEAIVQRDHRLESFDVPRGAFGSNPARPAEDLNTVSVSHRLVVRTSVSDSVVSDLTRLLFTMRPALTAQVPTASLIEALDPDEAAASGLHPGARAYLAGDQQTFIQRFSDWAYLVITALTMLASGAGALISHLSSRRQAAAARSTHDLQRLLGQIRTAVDLAQLAKIQEEADHLMADAVTKVSEGDINDAHFFTFTVVYQNVSMALQQREWQLQGQPPTAAGRDEAFAAS